MGKVTILLLIIALSVTEMYSKHLWAKPGGTNDTIDTPWDSEYRKARGKKIK